MVGIRPDTKSRMLQMIEAYKIKYQEPYRKISQDELINMLIDESWVEWHDK